MEITDPYTYELLFAPPPPGAFSGCSDADDAYLRAIGALPRRASALEPSSVMLPAPWDLFAAAHVIQPAVEVEVEISVQQPLQTQRDRKRVAPDSDVAATKNSPKRRRRTCPWRLDYDADIDINLREKERNVKEQPSPDYLKTVQVDRMDEQTRSNLVTWMNDFTKRYHLAPGTLHRAVSYVDRVLSVRTLSTTHTDYELRLLGVAAVFTFVDHYTRNSRGDKNMEIRSLAHHLAETSLLDYGCLQFMLSGVAAMTLFLATLILKPAVNQ